MNVRELERNLIENTDIIRTKEFKDKIKVLRETLQKYIKNYNSGDYSERKSMEYGIDKQGRSININQAIKNEKYTCPVCQRNLIFADGKIVSKYFRHNDNTANNNECVLYTPFRLILSKYIEDITKWEEENAELLEKWTNVRAEIINKKFGVYKNKKSFWEVDFGESKEDIELKKRYTNLKFKMYGITKKFKTRNNDTLGVLSVCNRSFGEKFKIRGEL